MSTLNDITIEDVVSHISNMVDEAYEDDDITFGSVYAANDGVLTIHVWDEDDNERVWSFHGQEHVS